VADKEKEQPPIIGYATSSARSRYRRLLISMLILICVAITITFLPIWRAHSWRGEWRTTLWESDVFVIYDQK
jgi:hypothetical protein